MVGLNSAAAISSVSQLFGFQQNTGPYSTSLPVPEGLAGWKIIENRRDDLESDLRKFPDVNMQIEKFKEKAPKIESVDDLLNDYETLQFVLTSFGLEDQINYRALLKKTLESDPDDPQSFANKMTDSRFKEMALIVNFHDKPQGTLAQASTQLYLEEAYVDARFELAAGNSDPALRVALNAKRKLPNLTSYYQIIGDRPLSEFIHKSFGFPEQIIQLDIDQIANRYEKAFDLADFKDPDKLDSYINRYLALSSIDQSGGISSSGQLALGAGLLTVLQGS